MINCTRFWLRVRVMDGRGLLRCDDFAVLNALFGHFAHFTLRVCVNWMMRCYCALRAHCVRALVDLPVDCTRAFTFSYTWLRVIGLCCARCYCCLRTRGFTRTVLCIISWTNRVWIILFARCVLLPRLHWCNSCYSVAVDFCVARCLWVPQLDQFALFIGLRSLRSVIDCALFAFAAFSLYVD